MPFSTYFADWLGVNSNCFSISVELGREGSIRYLHLQLNQCEQADTAGSLKINITRLLSEDA